MYFSGHLLDGFSKHISDIGVNSISEIVSAYNDPDDQTVPEYKDKQWVKIAGIITSLTRKTTKNGDQMAFFTLSDRYSEIECIAFSKQYAEIGAYVREDEAVCVEGTISIREDEKPKVLLNKIVPLTENSKYGGAKTEEKTNSTPPSPKRLFLRVENIEDEGYLKAANLIDIFEGNTAVVFYDTSKSKYFSYNAGLNVDEFLLSELKKLLGEENVVFK